MCNSLRGQICILGDMYIHYDCPDHPLTAKTLDMLYMYNFKQVVTQSTHRRGHILDCVIIRPNDQVHLSSEVTDSLIICVSYHALMFLLLVVVLSIGRPPMLEISVALTVRLLLPTLRQSLLVLAIPFRLISIM